MVILKIHDGLLFVVELLPCIPERVVLQDLAGQDYDEKGIPSGGVSIVVHDFTAESVQDCDSIVFLKAFYGGVSCGLSGFVDLFHDDKFFIGWNPGAESDRPKIHRTGLKIHVIQ